ncbi:hypothetical protein [Paractinoplanes deccanensis]|uniref:hypothetical protein n=1 Tax=Paractinoplanes deccanensis TaxID=113561 RepID=UPI0019420CF8|nr:hypothetical protein [Actinoplanes deccanensis]
MDGVINGHPRRCGWDSPPKRIKPGFPVYFAPELADHIRAVHTSGLAEVRWCTTWCGYPFELAQLSAMLDLPFKPAFGDRPAHLTWADMKLAAAVEVLKSGRRLIWADDEEADVAPQFSATVADAEQEGRALLIAPESERGLRPEDLDRTEKFAAEARLAT